jgi:hypothetical protein
MPGTIPMEIKDLRKLAEEKAAELSTYQPKDESGKGDGSKLVLSREDAAKFRELVAECKDIRDTLESAEVAAGLREWFNRPAAGSVAGTDAGQQRHGAAGNVKSLSDRFLDSAEWKEMRDAKFRPGTLRSHEFEGVGIKALGQATEVKDVYTAMAGDLPSMPVIGQSQNVGFTDRMLRPGRVRDLFPAESTNASILYGIRETGYTNRAAVVPERTAPDGSAATGGPSDVFGLKPKSDLTLVPYSVGIATIAHIMYVHKNVLDDEPRMRGILDRDMIDGVKMVEDEQLLYGDGVGDNILGLTQQPGIQLYNPGTSTNDKKSAQIRRAITRVLLAYFQANSVILNPLDWEDMELEVDANGNYTIATSVAIGGEKRLWRCNVVDTPAMLEGRYLVGSAGYGAKVYDRMQVRIDVSTENRDMFERNAYTLRAEERIGLVVDRPEAWVYGTLQDPA